MVKGFSIQWIVLVLMTIIMNSEMNPCALESAEHLLVAETAAQTANQPAAKSFLSYEGRKTYSAKEISTAVLAEDDSRRTVVFGERVEMYFFGVEAGNRYELELTLLSDSNDRVVNVIANNRMLEEKLALPCGQPMTRRWVIPPEAIVQGDLYVEVRKAAGANAVVSAMRLFCSNPQARPPDPIPPKPTERVSIPRLTPRPAGVWNVQATTQSLCGLWQFNPSPAGEFWKAGVGNDQSWRPIQVPGEWVMQGFTVKAGEAAGYRREFTIPSDWAGQRVKLRCDAVYCDASVWVNGLEAGTHVGGFTPFELDVTDLIRPGQANMIALTVRSASKADTLANGTNYAEHDIGGILRKITLMAVPSTNIARLNVTTPFDRQYADAQLVLDFEIVNEGSKKSDDLALRLSLRDPSGQVVDLAPARVALGKLRSGTTRQKTIRLPVTAPLKWESEHPRLYQLACELESGGRTLETVQVRVGFRQVEVCGNEFLINGVAVKLHGASHHEIDPLHGRAVAPALLRRDAELMRDCNMNYARTSHYPPSEEFLDACDELGLFVESEAPFCWAEGTMLQPDEIPSFMIRPMLEMVQFHRNHPSVILWSLANESHRWRDYFRWAADAVKAADPTRPRNFSGADSIFNDDREMEIGSPHYPGLDEVARFANEARPTIFDEFIHLNCYNREEMVTDPGLRDIWGLGTAEMWERTYAGRGIMGGSLWSFVDEIFYAPGGKTLGFGAWGPIDGWRRPKPEYWHVKKFYSPIHIAEGPLPVPTEGAPLRITVQNRHNFTNLDEISFAWSLGKDSGKAAVHAAPHTTATLEIPLTGKPLAGQALTLEAMGPKGKILDAWRLPIGTEILPATIKKAQSERIRLKKTRELITVRAGERRWEIDARTGVILRAIQNEKTILCGGPTLMLLPLAPPPPFGQLRGSATYPPMTAPCSTWQASSVKAAKIKDQIEMTVQGEYREARGTFVMRFSGNGTLAVQYAFTVKEKVDPRQIGLVFDLPRACDTLSWRRKAQWSVYPEDHIGRPYGSAKAFPRGINVEGLATPRLRPDWPWALDANELGSNDFRSTKMNIFEAALHDPDGVGGRVVSNGTQHARAWVDGDRVRLLVADYINEGSAGFFIEHVIPNRPLAPGSAIQGEVTFCMNSANQP